VNDGGYFYVFCSWFPYLSHLISMLRHLLLLLLVSLQITSALRCVLTHRAQTHARADYVRTTRPTLTGEDNLSESAPNEWQEAGKDLSEQPTSPPQSPPEPLQRILFGTEFGAQVAVLTLAFASFLWWSTNNLNTDWWLSPIGQ
jgi:hypothetical protein